MKYKYQQLHLKKQRGVVIVILAAGMAALLAVAGLALDSGNLFLNKSKLQNAADASALSAGVALNAPGGNYQKAVANAIARFESVIATEGNQKLQEAYNSNQISLTVTTSPTLSPFVGSNADDDWYVRVAVSALPLDSFFLRVIGIDTLDVPASAVAGRTPVGLSDSTGGNVEPICGLVPMMVCGDPTKNPADDPNPADPESFWGYTLGDDETLKTPAPCNNPDDSKCAEPVIGAGNFQLVDLPETGNGGAGVREAMAGAESCINGIKGGHITTEPGNVVGPVAQGLNTRFGMYTGPLAGTADDYPADYVQDSMDYENYQSRYKDEDFEFPCEHCDKNRRVVAVPIGNCTQDEAGEETSYTGKSEIPLLDIACFFLTEPVGRTGQDSVVYGQFVKDCPAGVTPNGEGPVIGEDSTGTPGGKSIKKAYIIQLYKNPGSRDS